MSEPARIGMCLSAVAEVRCEARVDVNDLGALQLCLLPTQVGHRMALGHIWSPG